VKKCDRMLFRNTDTTSSLTSLTKMRRKGLSVRSLSVRFPVVLFVLSQKNFGRVD